ncbi:hypothetical protein BDN70DRAFT_871049 [Pholiota conissans]|uniref:Uncharacterized protein n=1 Tax=Pholiota conissans TaxID=109636 RepID=A0A9P6D6M1_9AGAR|nr:hypothetical protein BDN70DRAFT_871049 [Pholiota conissans]
MAAFFTPRGFFILNSDLIYAIIDEIDPQNSLSNPPFRSKVLCTLSCVCKAFLFAARSKLLSSISLFLYTPEVNEKRAAILFGLLQKKPALLHSIRSMALIFKGPAHVVRDLGISAVSGPTIDLINLVLRSISLKHFSIEQRQDDPHNPTPHFEWSQLGGFLGTTIIMSGIHANPSLESLRFINIHSLPPQLILSRFSSNSLRELSITDGGFSFPRGIKESTRVEWDFSSIEVLTLLGQSMSSMSAFLKSPYAPLDSNSNPISLPAPTYFTRLHTLRIRALFDHTFFLSIGQALQTLELCVLKENPVYVLKSVPLDKLTRLKTFKIYMELGVNRVNPHLLAQDLKVIRLFLQSISSLTNLLNIHIGFLIEMKDFTFVLTNLAPCFNFSYLNIINSTEWARLDKVLSNANPNFTALQHISLRIEKYYPCNDISMEGTCSQDEDSKIPLSSILPFACQRHTLRHTDFGVYSIYTSENMAALVDRSF